MRLLLLIIMSLLQHWKLDDNAASTTVVATVGANATLLGGDNTSVKHFTPGPGTAITSAFDLNGTDDAIDISAAGFSRSTGLEWSVSAWWNRDATGNFGILGVNGSTNNRITSVGDTVLRVTSNGATSVDFTVSFTSGTWYHVLVTHSAANATRCFINAVESSTGSLTLADTFAPTRIGNQNTVFFNGKIAWVKLFHSDQAANVAALYAEKDLAASGSKLAGVYERAYGGALSV